MTPRKTPSKAAYARMRPGEALALNDWMIAKTNATSMAPMPMPYDIPRFSGSTGSSTHERVAVTKSTPSVMAVRLTTSSMVIALVRAGACGIPVAGSVAYGLVAYGLVPACWCCCWASKPA